MFRNVCIIINVVIYIKKLLSCFTNLGNAKIYFI